MKQLIEHAQGVAREASAALASPDPLPSTEYARLQSLLARPYADVDVRFGQIKEGGAVRQQVLGMGSEEEVSALLIEFERIKTLRELLREQRDQLTQRRKGAELREASAGLPALLTGMEKKLAETEAAKEALEQSLGALQHAYHAVQRARAMAGNAGLPRACATRDVGVRMSKLAAHLYGENRGLFSRTRGEMLEDLGVTPKDELETMSARIIGRPVEYSGDADYVMRRTLEIALGAKAVEGKRPHEIQAKFEELAAAPAKTQAA